MVKADSYGYEIWLTNDYGLRLAQIDNFLNLEASKVVNRIAFFGMSLPLSFDIDFIKPDNMIQIWRQPPGSRLFLWNVYFIRKWKFSTIGGQEAVGIAGPDINDLLRRRIVAAYSGSAQAVKADYADDMMKEVVTESIADGVAPTPDAGTRVWSDLSIQGDLGNGPTITKSFPFGKLLTTSGQGVLPIIEKAAREEGTEVFFAIEPNVISGNSITFQFRTYTGQPGQDVSSQVTFDQDDGNMQDPELEYDYTEEENYIYAAGQGEGIGRNVQQVYDSDRYGISQWARCEGFADARDQASNNGVISSGNDQLYIGRPRVRFTATPLDTEGTRFGENWDFGYLVGTKYKWLQFNSIIWVVTLKVDENGEDIGARLDYEAAL